MSKNTLLISFRDASDWLSLPAARRMIRDKKVVILDPRWPMREGDDKAMLVMSKVEFDYVRQRILTEEDYLQTLLLKQVRRLNFVHEPPERYKHWLVLIRDQELRSELVEELATNEELFKFLVIAIWLRL